MIRLRHFPRLVWHRYPEASTVPRVAATNGISICESATKSMSLPSSSLGVVVRSSTLGELRVAAASNKQGVEDVTLEPKW